MAVIDRLDGGQADHRRGHESVAVPAPTTAHHEPRGFRPASRRRSRIALGVLLAAVAIGGNALVYATLNDRTEVLQLINDVRAGEVITSDDLRIIEADVDPTVAVVTADQTSTVVGHYARTYLASGSLLVDGITQPDPLVADGAGVVEIDVDLIPSGITTRSQVMLVVPNRSDDTDEPFVTPARVVRRAATDGSSSTMSVEVPVEIAPLIAAADGIRLVLVEPGVDEAAETNATR